MSSLETLADELGALEQELAPYRSKINRAELIRKAIRNEFRDAAAGSEHRIAGERFAVVVGACGNVSVVDRSGLIAKIGQSRYCEIADVSLKAIETHCGAGVLASVVSSVQTGPRALTVSALPRPAADAIAPAKAKPVKTVARGRKAA